MNDQHLKLFCKLSVYISPFSPHKNYLGPWCSEPVLKFHASFTMVRGFESGFKQKDLILFFWSLFCLQFYTVRFFIKIYLKIFNDLRFLTEISHTTVL